jgi:hypothetical protein
VESRLGLDSDHHETPVRSWRKGPPALETRDDVVGGLCHRGYGARGMRWDASISTPDDWTYVGRQHSTKWVPDDGHLRQGIYAGAGQLAGV